MIVDSTGIRPPPSELEAIEKMAPPSNAEELRAFLGMTGYLRQFIRNYSITAAPLTYLLRKKKVRCKKKSANSQSLGGAERRGSFIS